MSASRFLNASTRPPAVAGTFYPDDPDELRQRVSEYMASADLPVALAGRDAKAILAPHAGYLYSGPIAGTAFRALATVPKRVVVLSPSHRVAFDGIALPTTQAFATPLGTVAIDDQARVSLATLPQIQLDDHPHADEHGIEVELPFLQVLSEQHGTPCPSLVPLVVGRANVDQVAEALDLIWGNPKDSETLILISSDLSHFLTYDQAARRDHDTVERILTGASDLRPEDACGATAINGLQLSTHRDTLEPYLLDLRSSGDTAGNKNSVVGYCAIAFHPKL
ncbi:MAG: AmmeMemoRadiSam system protein B [Acidobacteriota bacterium]